jgi:hypothetical protein
LEAIGVLIPFLFVPELLACQHILLRVDCFGTIYGFMNKVSKGDETASVFIRAVFMIAAYLSCAVHVEHLSMMSDFVLKYQTGCPASVRQHCKTKN